MEIATGETQEDYLFAQVIGQFLLVFEGAIQALIQVIFVLQDEDVQKMIKDKSVKFDFTDLKDNTQLVFLSQLFGFISACLSVMWYVYNMCQVKKDVIAVKAYKETFIIFLRNLDAFKFFSTFYEGEVDQIYAMDTIIEHEYREFKRFTWDTDFEDMKTLA